MMCVRKALRALLVAPLFAAALSGCASVEVEPAASTPPATVGPPTTAPATGDSTTLGALADRIGANWPSAVTIRWTTTTLGADYAADGSIVTGDPIPGFSYINEVDTAGNRRMTILSGPVVAGQLLAIDGAVWAWGLLPIPASAISAPDDAGWVQVTPEAALVDAQAGQLVTSILAPVAPVYAVLTASERARLAIPIADQTFGDRACPAWRLDQPNDGAPIVTIIGIDGSGLVCGVAITYGGQTSLGIWTFGAQVDIDPPTGTPVPPSP